MFERMYTSFSRLYVIFLTSRLKKKFQFMNPETTYEPLLPYPEQHSVALISRT